MEKRHAFWHQLSEVFVPLHGRQICVHAYDFSFACETAAMSFAFCTPLGTIPFAADAGCISDSW